MMKKIKDIDDKIEELYELLNDTDVSVTEFERVQNEIRNLEIQKKRFQT